MSFTDPLGDLANTWFYEGAEVESDIRSDLRRLRSDVMSNFMHFHSAKYNEKQTHAEGL